MVIVGFVAFLAGGGIAATAAGAEKPGSAGKARSAAKAGNAGNAGGGEATGALYGTVVTDAGSEYTGVLRWGDEEAFWDDLFNGDKAKLPYIDRLPESRRNHRVIGVLGMEIDYDWDEGDSGRQFVARFGDLQEIRPRLGEKVDVVMKNGTTYRLDDGSNDIGAVVHVEEAEGEKVEVPWKRIEKIVFAAAPASARLDARRLAGEVATEDGVFRGSVQWDSQECLSTDRLDGHSEDGKVSLPMGAIRSIAKENRKSARVELKDGRSLVLRGTNDVDASIRGIMVEDERFGRVKVSWEAFQRVDFRDGSATGRGYSAYKPASPLRGTVTDHDGGTWKGRLVFDLDESETWELLNGDRHGIEYSIPFALVRTIAPRDDESCDVTLRGGQVLRLEDSQDVTSSNAGVLVLREGGGTETYVPWDRIRRIDFE
jgi:sporulation protein YlmC with PRC-barrel domain